MESGKVTLIKPSEAAYTQNTVFAYFSEDCFTGALLLGIAAAGTLVVGTAALPLGLAIGLSWGLGSASFVGTLLIAC